MRKCLTILVGLLSLFTFTQPVDALIKRSKKSECTVCHVLWMEDLQTNQENLLGTSQENIVIAGSIGLSSSQQICYSCHDGYVVDSRMKIIPGNKHHQLKKVPDWLDLPDVFRLDINNEFYCGTCHGFHDVKASGEIGTVPFMRIGNDRSEMCMACHKDKKEKLGVSNHPLLKKSDLLSREKIEKLGGKVGPAGEIICQSCHLPHGNPPLLKPLNGSQICLVCHDDKKTVFRSAHNIDITSPKLKNTQGKGVTETGPCSSCHLPHKGNGKWMWAREKGPGNSASLACRSCHDKTPGIRTTGRYSHPVDVVPGKDLSLPLYADDGLRAVDGKVQCPTCHNAHQWNPEDPDSYVDKVEGGPGNSFLRKNNELSELCLTCHDKKKSLIGTDHDLRITAPGQLNSMGLKPSASGPCGVCHIPHRAANEKLWAGLPSQGNLASAMCLACHDEETEQIKKTIGEHSHPVDITLAGNMGKDINLPLFAELGREDITGNIQCATCHNPHQWDPVSLQKGKNHNIEGDASNSFLRIANKGQSALCVECHDNKKQVLASDHNLLVTAPEEKNITGASSSESGPCGACHVPHNAANKRLWAKQLSGENDFVSQLCFSCHNKDGAALEKSIGEHDHPVNVDLTKIDPENKIENVLPLYKERQSSSSTGKVVCITCHDPHTWQPGTSDSKEQTTAWANKEGNNTSSFLRKENYPSSALCKTCHVEQALIVGTPHDLTVKVPQEKNLLGQAAQNSGECGVCHIVHNSPNDLKLWARPYGPLNENDNKMAALCTSCHSKGNVAQNKTQEIATHPLATLTSYEKGFIGVIYDEKAYKKRKKAMQSQKAPAKIYTPILITNVIGVNSGKSFTPIFNDKGEKVMSGKISCPSCHNVHKWNLNHVQGEEGKNINEKKGAKFLRNKSSNLVCIDCHGQDGLYRYLYFHSIKRDFKIK